MGVLSSSIWVLHQGLIFLAAMEWKNINELVLFQTRTLQSFDIFYVFFHGIWKPCNEPETSGEWAHKCHKMALLFITRFSYWAFLYLLSLIRIFSVICLFWQTLTAHDDTRTRQHPWQGRKYFTPKWRHLMLLFAGETSRAFALLLAFAAETIRKYTTRTLCSWKNLSSTCRQV